MSDRRAIFALLIAVPLLSSFGVFAYSVIVLAVASASDDAGAQSSDSALLALGVVLFAPVTAFFLGLVFAVLNVAALAVASAVTHRAMFSDRHWLTIVATNALVVAGLALASPSAGIFALCCAIPVVAVGLTLVRRSRTPRTDLATEGPASLPDR